MAFTERYVTDAAPGGGDGQIGTPWTLAEALAAAVAGDRVNILSDSGYALSADTVTNSGTAVQLICFRGYNSSIGDLENNGWNADGTLDVTGFPIITLSGVLSFPGAYILMQNLVFTASSINAPCVGSSTGDQVSIVECKITNSTNNAGAGALRLDDNGKVINCDLECSGAAHAVVVDMDGGGMIVGNRIKGVEASQIFCQGSGSTPVIGNLFQGASGAGIGYSCESGVSYLIYGNTFYDLGTAITMVNAASTAMIAVVNNHVTDCGEYINNLYSGTANKAIIEVNNRTRDNTTPRTGIGDGANVGEVTTDTGGASTDYTNVGANNFTLIDGAPGVETGMRQHTDIGAYQRAAGAGGGGGGKQAGSGGGQVG